MKKGSLLGLMYLAISDFLFCTMTITVSLTRSRNIAEQYVQHLINMYAHCIQNILIKTSTWFTFIIAVSRYFVVTRPIIVRQYLRCSQTAASVVLCLIIWALLFIPCGFRYKIKKYTCPSGVHLFPLPGSFHPNRTLYLSFVYLWVIMRFFIPVVVLAYCNTKLIYILYISQFRSNNTGKSYRVLNCTLIAIVAMFFICVFPSEFLYIFKDVLKHRFSQHAVLSMNLLQVVNFSANFALYCIVDPYFIKTMELWDPIPAMHATLEKT